MQIKRIRIFIAGVLLLVVCATILIVNSQKRPPQEATDSPTSSPTGSKGEKVPNRLLPPGSEPTTTISPRRVKGWGTHYRLVECGDLLRYFFEDPSRYYGIYDLQEDLGQPGSPDWTLMPWDELRRRYIRRYPAEGKAFLIDDEPSPPSLSPAQKLDYDNTRYRLILQPKK